MTSIEALEKKVNRMQRTQKLSVTAMMTMLVAFLVGAAADKPSDKLHLESPNGRYTIDLQAFDRVAGIWVTDKQGDGSLVSIYNEEGQGGVVGVWGPKPQKGALDVALSATKEGGVIQVVTREEQGRMVHFIKPTDKGDRISSK